MKVFSFLAVISTLAGLANGIERRDQVERNQMYVCSLDRVKILKTQPDGGSKEEWRVENFYLKVNGNACVHWQYCPGRFFDNAELKNLNGASCNPPEDSSNPDYTCKLHHEGETGAYGEWCVREDADSFSVDINLEIREEDGLYDDDGPIWDFGPWTENMDNVRNGAPNYGDVYERYFTREEDGRKGRLYMKCVKTNGRCALHNDYKGCEDGCSSGL